MSIANEIARLQGAKADLKTAIEGKGVTVPAATKLDGYADLVDDIQAGGTEINNQDKSVTPTESQQTVTADSGYTGLGTVTVGAIDSNYVGSNITRRTANDLTASGAFVNVPRGYYEMDSSRSVPIITGAKPTAEKGTVSNHGVWVTPSITYAEGYIQAGTKSGTAVRVEASELVSGTKQINANGSDIDVTDYESVDVSVPNSYTASDEGKVVSNGALVAQGSQTITENGTYDTTLVDDVTVNVSGGGGNGYGGDGTWSRPLDMPKLDDMDVSGGDVVYMTYIASEALGFCDLNIKRSSGSFTFDIGTINNGTFIVDSTSTYSADTTVKKYFGSSAGGYKVIRIAGAIKEITTNRNSWTTYDGQYRYSGFQGIVEIYGELPRLNKINFYNVGRLKAVRLGNAPITDLSTAFYGNYFLESVDSNHWDVSNCTSLYMSFRDCNCLEKIDVSNWETGNVTDCRSAFQKIPATDIDISSWDMSSVGTNSGSMLQGTKFIEITIPATLANVGTYMFADDNQHLIYHFKSTTPPTLANANAFNGYRSQMKIYVPSSAVNDYKTATNWSTYANYIEGE